MGRFPEAMPVAERRDTAPSRGHEDIRRGRRVRNGHTVLIALALGAALALGGCGGSDSGSSSAGGSGSSTTTTQADTGNTRASRLAKGHCTYSSVEEQSACENSYVACLETPEARIRKYDPRYDDPTLVKIATKRANDEYGEKGPVWNAGFAGCTAALLDKYARLTGSPAG
jgi:hypothetical protein